MSYFHVLVKLADNQDSPHCIFTDISLAELRTKFLKPYHKGQKILSGASVIDLMAVTWAQVIQTERLSEVELKGIQEKSLREIQEFNSSGYGVLISPGRGYSAEDISEAGEDVTSTYVKSPPGGRQNLIGNILNHPWVLAVLSGIIVAAIGAFFGIG